MSSHERSFMDTVTSKQSDAGQGGQDSTTMSLGDAVPLTRCPDVVMVLDTPKGKA